MGFPRNIIKGRNQALRMAHTILAAGNTELIAAIGDLYLETTLDLTKVFI